MQKRFFKLTRFLLTLSVSLCLPSIACAEFRNWAYWLQDINIPVLASSPYELLVIDYSRNGSQQEAFSPSDISELKKSGKTVLAYLSIGEAEEVRYYFKSTWVRNNKATSKAPTWFVYSNPNFPDNYKVKFWESAWQKIIFGRPSGKNKSYLDRILSSGFDGVYLDIIDAFEDGKLAKVESRNGRMRGKKQNAVDMAKFVISLATYARRKNPTFLVVPQNGSSIIAFIPAALKQKYFQAISGIGAEDTFFFGDKAEDNSLAPQEYVLNLLDIFRAEGKQVFAVDYLSDAAKINQFQTLACQHNFTPQVSNRILNSEQHFRLNGCER